MGMPEQPSFDQDSFRGRTNVTDPAGVNAAFDGGDAGVNVDWTQLTDVLFRIRFLIQQTSSIADTDLATEFKIQYRNVTQASGWQDVVAQGVTTDDVAYANATGFADGDNTTQLVGAGSFVTGDGDEVTPTDTITFTTTATSETEIEYALLFVGSQINDADVIELRLLYSDNDESPPATVCEAYTNTPSLTADVPVADRRGYVSWTEFEIPTAPRRGYVSWTEFEIPTAPRRGRISWTEMEAPDALRGLISFAEFETPNPPRRGFMSWEELELPDVATAGSPGGDWWWWWSGPL